MSLPTVPPARILGIIAVGLAALLSILGVPVTSAQGATVFAVRTDGSLPLESPFDAAWNSVRRRRSS